MASSISFKNTRIAWVAGICAFLIVLLYISSPHLPTSKFTFDASLSPTVLELSAPPEPIVETIATSLSTTQSKYAYVTLLAVDSTHDDEGDINNDKYFVSIRMQAYSLLHAKETRSIGIPFIVLAVKDTSEAKKERLRRDGAIIIEIEPVPLPSWLPEVSNPAWANIFDKLRMWELTQFERLIFMDADVVVVGQMDRAFESAVVQKSDMTKSLAIDNVPSIPEEYVFTAGIETAVSHNFPPTKEGGDYERGDYINAGFFIIRPSTNVLDHYLNILNTPDSFKTEFAEQDLLNQIHRPDGPMPWQLLDPIWNIHRPMQSDLDAGVRSVHGKWWSLHHHDLMPFMASWRWRMEGYFQGWDELHKS